MNINLEDFKLEALSYIDLVYKTAFYLVGNEEESQELVQNTYLRAYKFHDRFEKNGNCKELLFRLLIQRFMNTDYYGSQKPKSSDNRTIESNVGNDFMYTINLLPIKFKVILLLAEISKFSYKEIASIMDCSSEQIKTSLNESWQLIKQTLSAQYSRHNSVFTYDPNKQEMSFCEI